MMRQRPIIERIEPRILYSADMGPLLAPAVIGPPAAEQRVIDTNMEFAAQSQQAEQNSPHEVVFVDTRTPDYALLVQDIAAQSGRPLDVVMLAGDRDGLEQITEALAGRDNVAAVHIIAHGGDGIMQLGPSAVTADSLQRNPLQVEAWAQALTADADILLYGCDVAATAQGQLLVGALARLTGADVAASDDPTGNAKLGGNWNLEFATGTIEAQVALSQSAQDAWFHLLDTVMVSYEPSFANLADNAYEISGGNPLGQTFSYNSGAGTYTVDKINLVLYKDATANPGNVSISLRTAFGSGALASASIARASLATAEAWVSVTLSTPVVLTDSTTYFIRISGTGSGNLYVGVDDAGTYAGGTFIDSSGAAVGGKDMAFRLLSEDPPVVDLNAAGAGQDMTVAFTEQTPVLVSPVGTLADVDAANLASLTVTLAARPDGDAVESLSLNAAATAAAGGLTVGYTAATGVLAITGSAATATYQTILQGIQYNNMSDAPTTTDRSVTVVANDGTRPSATQTSTITVTAVNDAPVAAGTNPDQGVTVGTPFSYTVPAGEFADVDGDALTLTATLGDGSPLPAWLTFNPATRTFSGTPGGGDTFPIAVRVTATDPSAASALDTFTITTGPVNQAPQVDLDIGAGGTDYSATFTEGDAPLAIVGGAIAISDVDDASIESATVTLTNAQTGDVLAAGAMPAGITANVVGDTVALTGSASLADYQTAIQAITFENASENPNTTDRTITLVVNDGDTNSNTATSTISVAAVNDAPTVTSANTIAYTENDAATALNPGIAVADADSAGLAGATAAVSANYVNGEDVLSFTAVPATMGNISGSFDAASGTLTLSSAGNTATPAQFAAALAAVKYTNTSDNPGTAARALSYVVNDGAANSVTAATTTLNVTAVNDAPTVTSANTIAYTENDAATALNPGIAVADADSAGLAGATAAVSANYVNGEDVLSFTAVPATMGNISGSFDAASGTLTLSSAGNTATPAQFAAALAAVKYTNTSENPGTAARTLSYAVNDSAAGSVTAATTTLNITAVNDAPTLAVSGGTTVFVAGSGAVALDPALTVGEPDGATLASATVSISAGLKPAEDVLDFSNNPATMGNIAGSYNTATGVLALSSAGAAATPEQWQAALRSVTYANTNPAPDSATRAVSLELSDGAAFSPVVTRTVSVSLPAPVAPALVTTIADLQNLVGGIAPAAAAVVATPTQTTIAPAAAAVVAESTQTTASQQAQPVAVGSRTAALDPGAPSAESAEIGTFAEEANRAAASAGGGRLQSVVTAVEAGATSVSLRVAAQALAAAQGAEPGGDLLADVVRQVDVRPVNLFQLDERSGRAPGAEGLGSDLARLRDGLREQDEIQTRTVVTLTAGSLSVTFAYLIWLIRGGALAASMLSALPAWRLLDPLPILARGDGEEDESGEEDDPAIASFSDETGGVPLT